MLAAPGGSWDLPRPRLRMPGPRGSGAGITGAGNQRRPWSARRGSSVSRGAPTSTISADGRPSSRAGTGREDGCGGQFGMSRSCRHAAWRLRLPFRTQRPRVTQGRRSLRARRRLQSKRPLVQPATGMPPGHRRSKDRWIRLGAPSRLHAVAAGLLKYLQLQALQAICRGPGALPPCRPTPKPCQTASTCRRTPHPLMELYERRPRHRPAPCGQDRRLLPTRRLLEQ